jgi:hypothetical protein
MTLIRHAKPPNHQPCQRTGLATPNADGPSCGANVAFGVAKIKRHERSSQPTESSTISTSAASSCETHRFAMLLKDEVSYQTRMVRSIAKRRVSNHEASGEATMIQVNRKTI